MSNVGVPALLAVGAFLLIAAVLSMILRNRKHSGEPVDGECDGGPHSDGGDSGGCDAGGADGGCGGDGGGSE